VPTPPFDLNQVIAWLESLHDDRDAVLALPHEQRVRLMAAAGRLAHPAKGEVKARRAALEQDARLAIRKERENVLSRSAIRELRRSAVYETPPALPAEPSSSSVGELEDDSRCYVCKEHYRTVHHFYDRLCPACAELNWERRNQTADLRGRVALITGARVKIGYHAAIKLLRAGAQVIVTTRFPNDAALRFTRENDFSDWGSRLSVYGLDLRHTPSIERFCASLDRTLPRLDMILNNACQTVRRPTGFYRHLQEAERNASALPTEARRLLEGHFELTSGGAAVLGENVVDPVALSQLALTVEDREAGTTLFPAGRLDADLQQVDLRGRNSWRLLLHEVSTAELLEVQLINAVAPYVLNARLRPLMNRVPPGATKTRDKHIVNVSAMEGQFYRRFKTDRHPHTNMAKAALNMMTRTSAPDYVTDGIHMNSVDTGWITDEDPHEIATKKTEDLDFHPPLDVVDGAARIVDPIFTGIRTGKHVFGQFLKDYMPTAW
jgi:NAD(P)-dependent dehydrogenase (short-subunit alcohol dehydrogenase family)